MKVGDAVIGPGGLLGMIQSTTLSTSRVKLLTAPGNKLGVWIERSKVHAVLVGTGNSRPQINFIDRYVDFKLDDVISTSPASTLMPPNIPIGIIKYQNQQNLPLEEAETAQPTRNISNEAD